MNFDWVYPHCDPRILHAPGECKYCDMRPEWQRLRVDWGISFTGQSAANKDLLPCPAEHRRSFENLNAWPGNKAKKLENK